MKSKEANKSFTHTHPKSSFSLNMLRVASLAEMMRVTFPETKRIRFLVQYGNNGVVARVSMMLTPLTRQAQEEGKKDPLP